jgi:hypothetical protein
MRPWDYTYEVSIGGGAKLTQHVVQHLAEFVFGLLIFHS